MSARGRHQSAERESPTSPLEAVAFSPSQGISLPVVPVGPSKRQVVRRIGEASRDVYQELLELTYL